MQMSRSTWACELKFMFFSSLHFLACHAPRERVSWNSGSISIKTPEAGHAPRERVSWNCILYRKFCSCRHSHAPRERVSWNFLVSIYSINKAGHAPRERVSWNFLCGFVLCLLVLSRSTWACELKSASAAKLSETNGHAPRERVSWNCQLKVFAGVTPGHAPRERVSWNPVNATSRLHSERHAPRERVSWNFMYCPKNRTKVKVTLHVSVWVEMKFLRERLLPLPRHAPRERVSWNCGGGDFFSPSFRHAPRERVSWNFHFLFHDRHVSQSRSTWACELKWDNQKEWFEKNTSRSTWACELKLHRRQVLLFF